MEVLFPSSGVPGQAAPASRRECCDGEPSYFTETGGLSQEKGDRAGGLNGNHEAIESADNLVEEADTWRKEPGQEH